MPTESMDEYVEAIYRLGGEENVVPVGELAQHLSISVVSANEMVKRLAGHDLVEYEPYRGIRLTVSGKQLALHIVRCHRLWERFLTDTLGLPWDIVHDEACRLEHITSPLIEDRLSTFLGDPQSCPHGSPMPDVQREVETPGDLPLGALSAGQRAVVSRVVVEEPELLRYVDELGLRPDAEILIESVAPFGGPITLCVAGHRQIVGGQVTTAVLVRLVE